MGQKVLVLPQPCPKPPAVFLSPPCPLVISLISLFLPQGGCQQGLGKELSPSSLELAIFTSAWVLVLSSSPILPLQMCLLLELLPPDSQVSWELSLKKKKKKKASAQVGISRELGISARHLFASHAHVPMGIEQAKAFVVC